MAKEYIGIYLSYLMADPLAHWEQSIEWFVIAMRKRRIFAGDIIEMLHHDEVQEELQLEQCKIVQLLYEQFQMVKEGGLENGRVMFEHLCTMQSLSIVAKGYIFAFRGESYRAIGRYEEALADFNRALALDERDPWALAQRGVTYRFLKRYEEALADFDHALALDEQDSWVLGSRGQTYQAMTRYEEALIDYNRAITLDEKSEWILKGRGETYRLIKRFEEALADFGRVIALDEQDSWSIIQRGQTYRLMKRYEEALADFDRAIALDERDSWALAQRGQTYRLMKRYEEALADFDRAIALDERNSWALAQRGQTYRLMKRYEEALADFGRNSTLDETDGWDWYLRAQVHYLLHDDEAFQQNMQAAINLAKQTRVAVNDSFECWRWDFNLAVFALFLKSDQEAQRSYEQLIALCPFSSSLREALEDLEDLSTVQPENTLILSLQEQLRARIKELG